MFKIVLLVIDAGIKIIIHNFAFQSLNEDTVVYKLIGIFGQDE